ncbi:MAG: glycoside hydrolase family 127 protein [Clostridia bacterium]|nr:glycoside hydrolase family 127 protein [Clostridia bacterium]
MKKRFHGLKTCAFSLRAKVLAAILSVSMASSLFGVLGASLQLAFADEGPDLEEYLELHYQFEDGDKLGKDSGSHQYDGNPMGKVSQTEGKFGQAIQFDSSNHGSNDAYMEMPVEAVNHNALTVMAWVKADVESVGSYARIFAIEAGGGKTLHLMANTGSARTGYSAELYSNSSKRVAIQSEGMIPNAVYSDWHHVAITYDGKEVKLYVNAAFINSVEVTENLEDWSIRKAFLGKTAIWNDGTFNGSMDEVRVYSKVLSGEEINLAGEVSREASLSTVQLLSSLSIDGEALSEFNPFAEDYYRVLPEGTTEVPSVTAEAPYQDAAVKVIPAESIPGTTKIEVTYPGGAVRTVTLRFTTSDVALQHPELDDVLIDDPFWNDKLRHFCEVTAPYVLESWVTKTHDNLRNFDKVAAGNRNTKNYVGSMTWGESDFYAAMAGACRLLRQYPNDALEKQISGYVDHIFAASESEASGYFSVYNLLMTDGKVFGETSRASAAMDLFNLGYLLEFGIAYYEATGDARMLRVALRFLNFTVDYSDHGKRNFVSFHTGVEYNIAAMVEFLEKNPQVLEDEYLKDLECDTADYTELLHYLLAYHGVFTDPVRVNNAKYGSYSNDHIPYDQLRTATGHSVVATLYYFGLAEYGRLSGDLGATNAAYRLWENTVNKQMYITGGTGSVHSYEGFGGDYHLPNEAYSESCTSGALIQYSDSLSLMFSDSRYHDTVERALYNNLLGSIGTDGTSFFYTNPLATNTSSRYEWHAVPCCTKYGLLIFGNLPRYIYSYSDDDLYVNQFIGNTATLHLTSGDVKLQQVASWVQEGSATLTITEGAEHLDTLLLRLPDWSADTKILVNGKAVAYETENGYAVIKGGFRNGDTVSISADVTPTRVYANENVISNEGRVAIQRGPIVYCMEGIDNPMTFQGEAGLSVVLPKESKFTEKRIDDLYGGVIALTADASIMTGETTSDTYTLTMIPFYARSNRGGSSVYVWLAEDPALIDTYPVSLGDSVELKTLGAKYTASTNAQNPRGEGSRDIAVIVDGVKSYGDSSRQFDTFGATFNDLLGSREKIQWFGVQFDQSYSVTHIAFYEGGHWWDGGWFGAAPYVQVLIDGKWTDVESKLTPEYPGDSQAEQMPVNEVYIFTLSKAVDCEGIRVLGKANAQAGHASCAEIEVYGSKIDADTPIEDPTDDPKDDPADDPAGDPTDQPDTPAEPGDSDENSVVDTPHEAEKTPTATILLICLGCVAAVAIVIVIVLVIRKQKK